MQESRHAGASVDRTSTLGVGVALAIAAIGVGMTVTLLSNDKPGQPVGVGHNLPQEAPQAFADAVIAVDAF
jgi:hypothetical protein